MASTPLTAGSRAGRSAQRRWTAVKRNLRAYAFILPFMFLFITFNVIPFFWALSLSTVRGDLVDPVKPFVGIQNYISLTTDSITLKVFRNS